MMSKIHYEDYNKETKTNKKGKSKCVTTSKNQLPVLQNAEVIYWNKVIMWDFHPQFIKDREPLGAKVLKVSSIFKVLSWNLKGNR